MPTLKMWRYSRALRLGLALALGLTLLVGLLLTLVVTGSPVVALAQDITIRYVAPAPTGNDSGNNCTSSSAPCATVQHAVDEADPDDEIRVARGVYTGVQARAGVTQVVYVSKTVAIRGGYTTAFADPPDPVANPTTLDAQGQGRVLYVHNSTGVLISNMVISGSNAGLGNGGGLLFSNSPKAILTDNIIGENRAKMGGGLALVSSPNARLERNTLIDNVAATLGVNHGGGLYCLSSHNMTLTANIIRGNRDGGNGGGGLALAGCNSVRLAYNVISDNRSGDGGGGLVTGCNNVELTGNLISGNSANRRGGGASLSGSDNVTLIGNTVTNNGWPTVDDNFGAGLYIENSTNVNRAGNKVTDNSIVTFGGGLYLVNSLVQLDNNFIARNSALEGDGIYMIGDAVLTGRHNTLVGSSGEGLRLNSAGDSATLTNTIFATFTTAVNVQAGTATLERTLWFGNGTRTIGVTPPDGNNPVPGDPAFADDGYHLTFSSAAIDKGVDAGVKTDIDGDSRPCRLGPDLGADEISCRYLPIILKNH
jgi:parallel beta-helix repeat protein